MLSLILAVAGMLHAQDMATALAGSDRMVLLGDCYRFGVRDAEVARMMVVTVQRHRAAMDREVMSWNRTEAYQTWQREMDWRERCWEKLALALDPDARDRYWPYTWRVGVVVRLEALYDLRAAVGDEAFFAGRMPDPFPIYRR